MISAIDGCWIGVHRSSYAKIARDSIVASQGNAVMAAEPLGPLSVCVSAAVNDMSCLDQVMTCYLVRHGEAKPELQDPRRPLSDLGQRQVEAIARAAAARGINVAGIWHSDKLRARQTAEILARFLGARGITREVQGLAPDDDPAVVQAELESAPDRVMLVGHLPHLSRLVSLLVSGDPERQRIEIPTASMVCLVRDSGSWKLDWTLTPDQA